MMSKTNKYMERIILLACLVIAVQMCMIIFRGDTVCLNEGCKIVERLTTISPFYFNMIGLVYFVILLMVIRLKNSRYLAGIDWTGILLLSGVAVEGVLLAYQLTVVKVVCLYCMFILLVVVLLNILNEGTQWIKPLVVLLAVNLIFFILSFGPSLIISQGQSLSAGTYATSRCSNPSKELFLIFSEDCPHCQKVIQTLESCNSCDFHFNPIGNIQSLALEGFTLSKSYSPEINRVILSLLGIETVPVLLVKNPDGYSFVHGEDNIIRYIEKACFRPERLLYLDTNDYLYKDQGISVFNKEEGECEITVDCDKQ